MLAAAGDIPTLEIVAAAWLLRKHAPSLKVRVVNVVDLMCLYPRVVHPHGLEEDQFIELFTAARPVVFAFHGYQRAMHAIVHGRTHAERFHVRGYIEEGTTTTPFDMVVRNEMSRFHLCMEALRRSDYAQAGPLDRVVSRNAGPARELRVRTFRGHAGNTRLGLDRRVRLLQSLMKKSQSRVQ